MLTLTYTRDTAPATVTAPESAIRALLRIAPAAGITRYSVTDATGRDVTHHFN
jgi:hypothetical protein